jgi:hypothetical protein
MRYRREVPSCPTRARPSPARRACGPTRFTRVHADRRGARLSERANPVRRELLTEGPRKLAVAAPALPYVHRMAGEFGRSPRIWRSSKPGARRDRGPGQCLCRVRPLPFHVGGSLGAPDHESTVSQPARLLSKPPLKARRTHLHAGPRPSRPGRAPGGSGKYFSCRTPHDASIPLFNPQMTRSFEEQFGVPVRPPKGHRSRPDAYDNHG